MTAPQSGILDSRDEMQPLEKLLPDRAVALERLASRGGEAVVTASTLSCLLDPEPVQESLLLHPVERRIERGDMKVDHPLRALANQPRQIVAMPVLLFEQGKDHQFGATSFELSRKCIHIWACSILVRLDSTQIG